MSIFFVLLKKKITCLSLNFFKYLLSGSRAEGECDLQVLSRLAHLPLKHDPFLKTKKKFINATLV